MTIKEMIKKLRDFENHYVSILNDKYIDDELINEVVKRLEELDEMRDKIELLEEVIRLENIDITY